MARETPRPFHGKCHFEFPFLYASLISRLNTWLEKRLTPSIVETPKFLKEMKRASASTCDCLPDCQSTDLTYSVTSHKFT